MRSLLSDKILIVDDHVGSLHLLDSLLKVDHTVILAKTGEQALALARQQSPDLILLDVRMPDMDGYQVLKALKGDERTSTIPVIFITGLDRPEDEAQGLQMGAVDYIVKPFNSLVVRARVATHIKLVRQRRMLELLANIDGLTEMPNRRQFNTVFEAEWRRSRRNGLPLAIAVVDVDCFKQYNDHYGHAEGDRVLQALGRHLQLAAKRPGDLAARIGGEEFVLIMPGTDVDHALKVSEALRRQIEALGIKHEFSEVKPFITISIGLATSVEAAIDSADMLFRRADERLYKAKGLGRNQVVV
ncbi:GGDEF domain-containing protein [Nitrincola alkalilacustris]|uniref:GGDEF domain-containing protein n=1 Tax=Nitrincola alkalilacustris TaxID=1571224 RepID=UPI00124F2BBA|nr:diguanylate cyclase [Nitrincola alkalilacustris]